MKTTLATILFGVLVLAAPRVARAHDHEEGGGGRTVDHRGDDSPSTSSSSSGSSSSSSDSSSSSGSSSSSTYDTPTGDGSSDTGPSDDVESSKPACVEGACPGAPTWTFELGTLARDFRGPDVHATGADTPTPSPGGSREVGGLMRLTFTATEHLYLGTEVRIGNVTPAQAVAERDDRMGPPLVDLGLAGIIGARSRAGHFELDGELVGGVREYALSAGDDTNGTGATEAAAIVEARLRGVVWVGSRWFVSGEVAASPLDSSDVGGVISLGFTSRSFAAPEPPLPAPAGT